MTVHTTSPERQYSSLTRAWIALLATPLGVLAALVVGHGLLQMLGLQEGATNYSFWQGLFLFTVGTTIMIAAPLQALYYGWQAKGEGHPAAVIPMILGFAACAFFFISNLFG